MTTAVRGAGAELFKATRACARELDLRDPLRSFRARFNLPKDKVYLVGNSLGLQPKKARECVDRVMRDWARLGVDGHLHADTPWLPYHEFLTEPSARLVGAKPSEVVVMNTLTVNLHLLMVSFYRPTKERFKILIEKGAFPSDRYAALSQARFHGFNPEEAVLEIAPRPGEDALRPDDILSTIERVGNSAALVLFGSPNYLTGQAFDIKAITETAHRKGCKVGFDLAHGAGNLLLRLHDWGADFAVWCGYKYLNGGPGSLSGCFVHERHTRDRTLPRLEGWWGTNKKERFQMKSAFNPIATAEAWQLSNPPILPLAALRASLEIFDEAGMPAIRRKGDLLTGYLAFLLGRLPAGQARIITPAARGSQLSLRVREPREILGKRMAAAGVVCDFREPDIVRAAPAPLYNTFSDVFAFVEALGDA